VEGGDGEGYSALARARTFFFNSFIDYFDTKLTFVFVPFGSSTFAYVSVFHFVKTVDSDFFHVISFFKCMPN
jgi:hypothetical protein